MAPELEELEAYWYGRLVAGVPDGCLPWLPYPLAQFRVLLEAAMRAALRDTFLDACCGVGTKCLAAAATGLVTTGLEIVPAYAAEARRHGVVVIQADARTWKGYAGPWGIVYLNHPLADEGEEALLERRVQTCIKPGVVFITVNSMAPPSQGWDVVAHLNGHDLVAVRH